MFAFCQTLKIEHVCSTFRIISSKKLTKENIYSLRELGFLGYGQEFKILTPCDGSETIDSKETMKSPLGRDYSDLKFYVYEIRDFVDSSG